MPKTLVFLHKLNGSPLICIKTPFLTVSFFIVCLSLIFTPKINSYRFTLKSCAWIFQALIYTRDQG
nr:MAG TPA: hypothetical protein [Caudoviricetes sp.]